MTKDNFAGKENASCCHYKMHELIYKAGKFEPRLKSRILYGLSGLATYMPDASEEILAHLWEGVAVVLDNISECDVIIECMNTVRLMLQCTKSRCLRVQVLRKCSEVFAESVYRKEYIEYYIMLLRECSVGAPLSLKYSIAFHMIEITKNIQQQFSRFVIYRYSCQLLLDISLEFSGHGQKESIIMSIFKFSWFIDRVKQDQDLFKFELMIFLLHAFLTNSQLLSKRDAVDLLSLSFHYLIDWKHTSKEPGHMETFKLAFNFYLAFVKKASGILQQEIESVIVELVDKCNSEKQFNLFLKMKLITALAEIPWYRQNFRKAKNCIINFDFLEDVVLYIMPKHHKPIFSYEYSITENGEKESLKEIEGVKTIMQFLNSILHLDEAISEQTTTIIVKYH